MTYFIVTIYNIQAYHWNMSETAIIRNAIHVFPTKCRKNNSCRSFLLHCLVKLLDLIHAHISTFINICHKKSNLKIVISPIIYCIIDSLYHQMNIPFIYRTNDKTIHYFIFFLCKNLRCNI